MRPAQKATSGSAIGVIATGSPLHPERLERGLEVLGRFGYRVKMPLSPAEFYADYRHGFANGSPQMHSEAFLQLLNDAEVSAIITARGGYGSLDIIQSIPFGSFAKTPKLIVGMSDVTALLVQPVVKAQVPSVHGPGIGTSFADYDTDPVAKKSVDALIQLLQDSDHRIVYNGTTLRPGTGEGPILAGNLTMLTCLLGTPWDADYSGKVLVLEEVGSMPFQVHRSLTQLKLAGKLDSLAGLAFGRFSRCEAKHGPQVEEVLRVAVQTILAESSYPIVGDLPFGHWGENLPLALGVRARVSNGTLETLEAPVQ